MYASAHTIVAANTSASNGVIGAYVDPNMLYKGTEFSDFTMHKAISLFMRFVNRNISQLKLIAAEDEHSESKTCLFRVVGTDVQRRLVCRNCNTPYFHGKFRYR